MRGWLYGAASAALFGISAPLSKALLPNIPPVMLAGLLYLGAALGLTIVAQLRKRPWPHFSRSDKQRLACIALVGGFVAPTLLLIGLGRVSGIAGSLLMNLESVFTIVLATWLFGERLRSTEWAGAALMVAGAAMIAYQPGATHIDALGVLAIAAACAGWAVDNNLTQQISSHDPVAIVQVKGLTAGIGNVLLALAIDQTVAPGMAPLIACVVGFVCYGVSIVLDVYALRYLGAAREAAIFATAPFIGAAAAIPILGEQFSLSLFATAVLMAAGLVFFKAGTRRVRTPNDTPVRA
ncbi:MAG TPA: DMT family transporter [Vicinamibacterales bacterium]|nr:DMT family transporter [Vicinamibacterales bacterium]